VAKDDDSVPKKGSSAAKSSGGGPSPRMVRIMWLTRVVGILLGGFVTLVGVMSLVGLLVEALWVRLAVALVLVLGFPAFVSDRFFKRSKLAGGAVTVADVFAIVLLGVALVLVTVDFASRPLLVREGDRYARSGSRAMARIVYFLGGVSPVFPDEKGVAPGPSGSAAASAPASVPSVSESAGK
jgi:hypothetical protein